MIYAFVTIAFLLVVLNLWYATLKWRYDQLRLTGRLKSYEDKPMTTRGTILSSVIVLILTSLMFYKDPIWGLAALSFFALVVGVRSLMIQRHVAAAKR